MRRGSRTGRATRSSPCRTVVMVAHTLPIIRGADAIALIDGGAVAELGTTRNCSRAAAGTRACGAPRGSGAENPVDQVKVIQVWF